MTSVLERLLPSPGDVVCDRYELREEVGRGGFGVVYRATQIGLNEDVAVKILLPHVLENEDIAQRFEREVTVAKGLRHPNTIRILDYNRTAKGLPFYVMEFIHGSPLEDMLEEQPLSPERTRHIINQVLKSLAEAHSMGVVHRDLKPANLILTEIFGEQDFVKVLDFGIAKALGGDSGLHQTSTGMVLGTPAYMSPEQALGRKELDGRSDIYAAGLIIAECLAGLPVVQGETPYLVVAQHASAQPLQFFPGMMSSPLWPVIARATAKNPDDRYPDAMALRRALDDLGPLPNTIDTNIIVDGSAQPSPSMPHVTPVSGRMVMGGDHAGRTIAADSAQLALQRKRGGTGRAVAILLLLAVLVGGVAFAITRGGETSEGRGDDDQAGNETGPQSGETAASSNGQQPGEVVQGYTEEELRRRTAALTAFALATNGVDNAVPSVRPIEFVGDGIGVYFGEQHLGDTPLALSLPRVNRQLPFEFRRAGHRTRQLQVSLLQDEVSVQLDRERTTARDRDRERERERERERPSEDDSEEEEEETTSGSPFGTTRIHD